MPTRTVDLSGACSPSHPPTRRAPPHRATPRSASVVAVAVTTFGLFWPVSIATSTFVEAKTPGKTYCFLGKCHRVRTLAETQSLVGKPMTLRTSHYDDPRRDRFNPSNLTSSGEWFRAGAADNAASPNLPNGTIILAYNPGTQKSAVLRINNAGPYWGDRTLDVSRGAAQKLGFASQGVASLVVKVMRAPSREEATYRKGRRYAVVPGFIGTHASANAALADALRRIGGAAPSSPAPTGVPAATIVASAEPAEAATASAPIVASARQTSPPAAVAAGRPRVAAATQVQPVRQRTTRSSRSSARVAVFAGAPNKARVAAVPATVRVATRSNTTSNTRRATMDQNGYFKVDCRSTPDLCGSSGRSGSTSGTRVSSFRTSDASSSNRP